MTPSLYFWNTLLFHFDKSGGIGRQSTLLRPEKNQEKTKFNSHLIRSKSLVREVEETKVRQVQEALMTASDGRRDGQDRVQRLL